MTTLKTQKGTSVRRTDEPGRAPDAKRARDAASARNWLRDAHRQSGSWAKVARDFELGSKGSARRIALGEAELPAHVLSRYLALKIWRSAGRQFGKMLRSRALVASIASAESSVARYDNRGREIKE